MKIEKPKLKDPKALQEIESQHINIDDPVEQEVFGMENFISLKDAQNTLFTDKDAKIIFRDRPNGKESCTIKNGKGEIIFYTEKDAEVEELRKL